VSVRYSNAFPAYFQPEIPTPGSIMALTGRCSLTIDLPVSFAFIVQLEEPVLRVVMLSALRADKE
jgi:hypothetical protein